MRCPLPSHIRHVTGLSVSHCTVPPSWRLHTCVDMDGPASLQRTTRLSLLHVSWALVSAIYIARTVRTCHVKSVGTYVRNVCTATGPYYRYRLDTGPDTMCQVSTCCNTTATLQGMPYCMIHMIGAFSSIHCNFNVIN